MVAYTCNPSYEGGIGKRIMAQGQPQAKMWDPTWKITKAKKGQGMA
jgi:hypothetical protein